MSVNKERGMGNGEWGWGMGIGNETLSTLPTPHSLPSIRNSLPFLLRIEPFAQAVADEVERHHREHYRQHRKDEHVRRCAKEAARVVEHNSPTWRRRRHAEAQETQARLREDGACHSQACLNDHRLDCVR